MARISEEQLTTILSEFGAENSSRTRIEIFAELVDRNSLKKEMLDDFSFKSGLASLFETAKNGTAPNRLAAVSLLLRSASANKRFDAVVRPQLASILRTELPAIDNWGDNVARLSIARAVAEAGEDDWAISYSARYAVLEEHAEKTRECFVQSLIARVSLSEALSLVAGELRNWRPATNDVSESLAKRCRRIVQAFASSVRKKRFEIGSELGPAINGLLTSGVPNLEGPKAAELKIGLCRDFIGFVLDLSRSKFSVAADAQTYKCLFTLERWFSPSTWPKPIQSSINALSTAVSEVLLTFAKLNIPDRGLRSTLILLLGAENAKKLLADLSRKTIGLSPNILHWMLTGSVIDQKEISSIGAEGQIVDLDPRLAELFILADKVYRELEIGESSLADALVISDPVQSTFFARLITGVRTLIQQARLIGSRRGLHKAYETGQIVEYVVNEHDLGTATLGPSKRVKVKNPAVKREIPGRPPAIILKADVEPID